MNKELREVLNDCLYGNWTQAMDDYQKLDMTGQEFRDQFTFLNIEEMQNLTLLSFYLRNRGKIK